jgi:dihydrolipoamide dehydrogenase
VSVPGFIAQEGDNQIVTSEELLSIRQLPRRLAVIGGGVIGIEFAYLLNKLGVEVTVLELMDRILPMVDPEISQLAKSRMSKDGVQFYLGAQVQKVRDNHVVFVHEGQTKEVEADQILMAVGRAPNTEGLDAEKIGLEFDRKALKTDGYLRTNIPHIYAVGDVNGKAMLAHTASAEAEVAVGCICGNEREMHYQNIPSCIYLDPEIASVGLTEEQAREQYGDQIKVGKFPLRANGKSLIEGETDGMFKIILDSHYGEILGAHLYGLHVTEMIGEVAVAMEAEATAEEWMHTVHPHPSINEAMGEAVLAAWTGKAIHWG